MKPLSYLKLIFISLGLIFSLSSCNCATGTNRSTSPNTDGNFLTVTNNRNTRSKNIEKPKTHESTTSTNEYKYSKIKIDGITYVVIEKIKNPTGYFKVINLTADKANIPTLYR